MCMDAYIHTYTHTAAVGVAASMLRSRSLGIAFMLLFIARGLSCLGSLALALSDYGSCAAWALAKVCSVPVSICVHMYVRMCPCMYLCIYVRMHVYMYAWV